MQNDRIVLFFDILFVELYHSNDYNTSVDRERNEINKNKEANTMIKLIKFVVAAFTNNAHNHYYFS